MPRAPFALALLVAAAPAAARERLVGDGDKVTEERAVAGFTAVELRASLDLEVEEGKPFAVAVTLDRNLLPHLVTRVEGQSLVVDLERGCSYHGLGKVKVALPELRALALRSSGNAAVAGADLPRPVALAVAGSGDLRWSGGTGALTASLSGSGDVHLRGAAGSLTGAVQGSGDLRARELTARGATVSTSGSGDVELTVDGGPLAAAASGSGDITWWGRASPVAATQGGSGSVRHR